jgi:hypothetical protein
MGYRFPCPAAARFAGLNRQRESATERSAVVDAFGLVYRQPGGPRHLSSPEGGMLSVPARRPIKPVYVRKFVRLLEEGIAE